MTYRQKTNGEEQKSIKGILRNNFEIFPILLRFCQFPLYVNGYSV